MASYGGFTEYEDPGAAFSTGFEGYLMQQAAAKRQAEQDALARQREERLDRFQQEELRQGQDALKRQREEADERIQDKRRQTFERRVHDMLPGDIPDAGMLKQDEEFGTGYFPVNSKTGVRAYLGSRDDREKIAKDEKIKNLTDQLSNVQPGSPDFIRLATQYEMETGKSLPAGLIKAPTAAIRLNFNPRNIQGNAYTDAATGKPATPEQINDPGAKVERLAEPNPTAGDAAADRKAAHLDEIRKYTMGEFDKQAAPLEDSIRNAAKLNETLAQRTNIGDSVIAEQLLRMTAGGQGSGLRLNNVLIDRILQGTRTKWADLEVALRKVQTDPKKSLIFTDDQRTAIKKLTDAIEKQAAVKHGKLMKARRNIIAADNTTDIFNRSTDALDDLYTDEPDSQPSTSDLDKRADDLLKRAREGKK